MNAPAPTTPAPGAIVDGKPVCGHPVNTAKGDKPCLKPPGHDGGHVSRLPKVYKAVKLDVFSTMEPVPTTEEVEYGGGKAAEPRKEPQLTVDKQVKENYDTWVKAGKPKLGFNEAIKAGLASRYFMAPSDEEAVRAMLHSAARFHKISVAIAPLKKHESGKHMLYWRSQDIRPQEKREQAAAAAAAAATPPAQPLAPAPAPAPAAS
jgi:hypothetical protein